MEDAGTVPVFSFSGIACLKNRGWVELSWEIGEVG